MPEAHGPHWRRFARAGRIPIIAAAVIAILGIDFLALDDITTGRQPHFLYEYLWLGVSTAALVAGAASLARQHARRRS